MTKSSKPTFQTTFGHRDQKWFFQPIFGSILSEKENVERNIVKYLASDSFFSQIRYVRMRW